MKTDKNPIEEKDNDVSTNGSGNSFKIIPPPTLIRFSDPITQEIFGEFKEKDGVLTFEGKVDDAGKIFVDFVCRIFKDRIDYLIETQSPTTKLEVLPYPTTKLEVLPPVKLTLMDRLITNALKWYSTKRGFTVYIYKGSTDVCNPSQRLFITSNGNVGIGG